MENTTDKNGTRLMSSASTLAFVGDAYFGLLVRARLAEVERPVGELHSMSLKVVSATAQAKGFEVIEEKLTEKELAVFKRGRNLHTKNTPKSSSVAQYHTATGLEALFGYFYLNGESERAYSLFCDIWNVIFES